MDLSWADTEKTAGQDDFSVYAKLADDLAAHGMRPWFILDYQNPLYEKQRAVADEAGRAAFAQWAAAAAKQFRGQGVIWEIWNEPNNTHFWEPKPDPAAYAALALVATKAIKEGDPEAVVVGPAAALVDLDFLRACGEAGLFGWWDGVSVHPYRQTQPETAAGDFQQTRALLRRYTPPGRAPPALLAGEWGYSTAWPGFDENAQAVYLARMALSDLAEGVPLTIWYDWRDDGVDPQNPEHHFGLVRQPEKTGKTPVFDPKPAYDAAATLDRELRFYRLNKALTQDAGQAHLLLFERRPGAPEELPPFKLAVWTTSLDGHETVTLPIGPVRLRRVDALGRVLMDAAASGPSLQMQATAMPQYLTPVEASPRLSMLAAWKRWPREYLIEPGTTAVAQSIWVNPLMDEQVIHPVIEPDPFAGMPQSDVVMYPTQIYTQTTAPVLLPANGAPVRVRAGIEGWWQETWLTPTRTLDFAMTPLGDTGLTISVPNASGGRLMVNAGPDALATMAENGTVPSLAVPARDFPSPYGVLVSATLAGAGGQVLAQEAFGRVSRMVFPLGRAGSPSGLRTVADGDQFGSGDAVCRWADAPAGGPAALALQVDFSWGTGSRFYRFEPGLPAGSPECPKRVGFWVYGDDTPARITLRLHDATGQTFEPKEVTVSGKRWQAVWLELDPAHCDHSGGANDGKPVAPMAWDAYFIVEKAGDAPAKGTIYLLPPTLVFAPE